jgi:hypothetical protein
VLVADKAAVGRKFAVLGAVQLEEGDSIEVFDRIAT